MKIQNDTWIVIADGEKFLLLRNVGDTKFMNLEVVDQEASRNAPAHELATDRPGRRYDSTRQSMTGVTASGKSGLSQTDWHQVEEARFAEHVASLLGEMAAKERFERLVVIADPRTLGVLRQNYDAELVPLIQAEIAKDLTNLPLEEIEASISGYDE